ncbi:hypothetical protein NQ176_g8813 [Zarea fungicola]|uniref:Uncharacterized protein n=1 Tax=Zarea fungicola TaxID=93591 RepID=A0ACC1MSI8_9HYPO|nr:hypothetical protein NQ176_g8813 [Lecanicillium fungicola]
MAPMSAAPVSLLSLPWEIRGVILLEVLEPQQRREPIFDRKFMQKRVRLRNLFDETHPKDTNIYIEKPGTWALAQSARALQATSRRLRDDVTLLINEIFKTGKEDAPFILDIMIVKDVGVFPTWLCFPYRTKRILSLRVNLRIIRPDAKAVPLEWVELARYPESISPRWGELNMPTFWSFFAVLTLLSLSRLRYAQVVDEAGIKSAAAPTNEQQRQPTDGDAKDNQQQSKGVHATGSILKHRSSVLDAYLVPMEETPYVVDQLHIDYKPTEYRPNGKVIVPGVEDKSRNGPFYKEGHVQFGREVFHDNTDYSDSWETHELQMEEKAAGRIASGQLLEYTWQSITRMTDYKQGEDELAIYHYTLASSVGEVVYSPPVGNDGCMMSKNTDSWISAYESDGDWRTMNISKAIAKEEASEEPAKGYIALLQLAKRRSALGWQAQFDEKQEAQERDRSEKDKKQPWFNSCESTAVEGQSWRRTVPWPMQHDSVSER